MRKDFAELKSENQILREKIEELGTALAKSQKNSRNSSKPPSSDITKDPKKKGKGKLGKGKRKPGGQPGHPKHDRPPFNPDEIDETVEFGLDACPDCLAGVYLLENAPPAEELEQAELKANPITRVVYKSPWYWCPCCEKEVFEPIPKEISKAGLCGPRLTSLVAFLKGRCHASYSTIRKYFRDVVGMPISRGQLRKLIGKATDALEGPYEELLEQLPWEHVLNIDETGHKENGKRMYTWVFRAATYALFKIDEGRASTVLIEVLGKQFNGVIGCDYFSAYRKFMKDFDVRVQFCLAHLIRDVRFLMDLPDKITANYGQRLLDEIRKLFRIIHRREHYSNESKFCAALERARDKIVSVGKKAPVRSEAQNMADRFKLHGKAYFEFITTPNLEPTNNLAEQAIRFVVIDRKVTQGTRSIGGRKWCERIWTTIATLTQQGRSEFDFLCEAIKASFNGDPPPTLLPAEA